MRFSRFWYWIKVSCAHFMSPALCHTVGMSATAVRRSQTAIRRGAIFVMHRLPSLNCRRVAGMSAR